MQTRHSANPNALLFLSSSNLWITFFAAVLLLSLIARVRFGPEIYMSGDLGPWWPTDNPHFEDLGIWSQQNGGELNPRGGWIVPWAANYVGHKLGLGAGLMDGLGYALPVAVGAAGVMRLAASLGIGPSASLVAASYYGSALDWSLNPADAALASRALVPWLAFGAISLNRSVGTKHATSLGVRYAIVAVAFGSIASVNAPQVVVAAATILMWILAHSISQILTQEKRFNWFVIWCWSWLKVAGFTVLFGSWLYIYYVVVWLFPIMGVGGSVVSTPTNVDRWAWTHGNASFGNLFVGVGLWGWRYEYFGVAYDLANNSVGRAILVVPSCLAMIAQFLRRSLAIKIATLTLLVVLFLMKGIHEPFADLNRTLHNNIPGMQLLREPISKLSFLWLLLNALLLGVSLHELGQKYPLRRWMSRGVYFGVWASVAFTFSLNVREVKDAGTDLMPPRWVSVPADWYEVRNFVLNSSLGKSGRTLVLPPNDFYAVPYVWNAYAVDLLPSRFLGLTQVQIMEGYFAVNQESIERIRGLVSALDDSSVDCEVLRDRVRLLGVTSALLRYDVGSRNARPLGTGPAITDGPTRWSSMLAGCGWRGVFRNPSLELLEVAASDSFAPLPVSQTGRSITFSRSGSAELGSLAAIDVTGAMMSTDGAVRTSFPGGYGFTMVGCGTDPGCGMWSIVSGWLWGRKVSCGAPMAGEWCSFRLEAADAGAYQVRNAWEDAYLALVGIGAGSCMLCVVVLTVAKHNFLETTRRVILTSHRAQGLSGSRKF